MPANKNVKVLFFKKRGSRTFDSSSQSEQCGHGDSYMASWDASTTLPLSEEENFTWNDPQTCRPEGITPRPIFRTVSEETMNTFPAGIRVTLDDQMVGSNKHGFCGKRDGKVGLGRTRRSQQYPASKADRLDDQSDATCLSHELFQFADAYRKLDQKLVLHDLELTFRDELDTFVAREVQAVFQASPKDVLAADSPFIITREATFEHFVVRSRILEQLTDLLERIVKGFSSHTREAVAQKLAEFVGVGDSQGGAADAVLAIPATGTAETVRGLLELQRPSFPSELLRQKSSFPATALSCNFEFGESKAVSSACFIVWRRNQSRWRGLATQASVLKPRDIPFLASLFPRLTEGEILATIDEELGSAAKFKNAASGHSHTALFIKSGENRFGCFSQQPWNSKSALFQGSCFMFSLSERREVPLDLLSLAGQDRIPSIRLGPTLASLLSRHVQLTELGGPLWLNHQSKTPST